MTYSLLPSLPVYPVVKPHEFQQWLSSSKPGDQFVYHRGRLAAERDMGTSRAVSIGIIATAALDAHRAGKVVLAQRRNRSLHCSDYVAIRSSHK